MSETLETLAEVGADDEGHTLVDSSTEAIAKRPGFWKRISKNLPATISLGWLVLIALMAIVPQLFTFGHDPLAQNMQLRFGNPTGANWLGTDGFGRDIQARLVYGSRYAFAAIGIGLGVATAVGIPIGMLSGWLGGRFDRAVMWVVDVIFALPLILIAMAVVTVLGQGLVPAMVAVGFLISTRFCRMARGVTLAEREQLYVDSARITGLKAHTILRRYVLPNLLPDLMVGFAIVAGAVLLISAVLSFLGVGAGHDSYDWASMLNAGRSRLIQNPWQVVPPSLILVFTVLAFNLFGDGVRDSIGRDSSHNSMTVAKKIAREPAATPHAEGAVLSIRDLSLVFPDGKKPLSEGTEVLNHVSMDVGKAETLGIVGESGSGKSMTVLAALGLTPAPGVVTTGSVQFMGQDVTGLSEKEWQKIRGKRIAVIFQEPIAVLNPALTIGAHLMEVLKLHHADINRERARERAVELLTQVRVPDPVRRLDEYPHQMSGGMAQRVGIALALAGDPELLIADEPTTALDVTVQGQILDLLSDLTDRMGMTMIIITHDMGVIAEVADKVAVMYGGQVVEVGTADAVFGRPQHPYTSALLQTMPQNNEGGGKLRVIPGMVPPSGKWPTGCRFHTRCEFAIEACATTAPDLVPVAEGGLARCIRTGQIQELVSVGRPTDGESE